MAAQLPAGIRGLSLDLGNTLYALRAQEMSETNRHLHRFLEGRLAANLPYEMLNRLYVEIRERQFAQNRPTLCENDLDERLFEMIERVHEPPSPSLVREASAAYSAGFVETLRLPDGMLETIARLSRSCEGRVVVCSNFVLADPIRALLIRDDVMPLLRGAVVSCEIGYIKPHALMFQAVVELLGLEPAQIAHIGDDLDADIGGAKQAGMITVFTSEFRDPLDGDTIAGAAPDFVVASLSELRFAGGE